MLSQQRRADDFSIFRDEAAFRLLWKQRLEQHGPPSPVVLVGEAHPVEPRGPTGPEVSLDADLVVVGVRMISGRTAAGRLGGPLR